MFDTGEVALPAELQQIVERTRPTTLAREQVLPVSGALRELLPGGALQRGTTVSVTGSAATSMALALLAEASGQGSWIAVVGLPTLGLAAAAELGLSLERLVLVRQPTTEGWGAVLGALVGSFDAVLLASTHRVRTGEARRLAAHARERGSVLVQLDVGGARPALEPDVRLTTGHVDWQGLGHGHGRLSARRVQVEATGRRRAARPRRIGVWLTDAAGRVAVAEPIRQATVTSLSARRAG